MFQTEAPAVLALDSDAEGARGPEAGGDRPSAPLADADGVFRDLVASHGRSLHSFVLRRVGNRTDAEELTQQAFVEAARNLQAFRGDAALSTWLFGIAMNLVRNHLARAPERRHAFDGESALAELPSAAAGPERLLEGSQLVRRLDAELGRLPAEMRQVLMLVAVDEMSYEQAAVLLSVPIGTVRSRLSRARATLKARFAAAGIDAVV